MSILNIHDLAKSYGPQDVFEGLTLEVSHGAKIALVGPNGSGKTTLLRLIAGLENPTSGVIHRAKDQQVAYLPQQADLFFETSDETLWEAMLEVFADLQDQATDLRRLEAAMADPAIYQEALQRYGRTLEAFERAGGYAYEHVIERTLFGLGFSEDDFNRPTKQLSGGEKTRALLARLLLEKPDLLLLDEPTNHLDLAGIEWLEDYLNAWKGAVVAVAHDRAFLDAVVERVWDLRWGQVQQYRGNYTAYAAQRAERLARKQAEYKRQQQSIAQTEEFIRRNIAGQRSREAKGRRKRLSRLERIEQPQEYQPLSLDLGKATRSGDLVMEISDLTLGYDQSAPLFVAQEFKLRRGQRVSLLGPNGSGKTTLVRTILGRVTPLSGRIRVGTNVHVGYFAQGRVGLDPQKSVIETILGASELGISEGRQLLGRYRFSGDDVYKRIGELSGGEQTRIALAVLALQDANFLILDEPTNHLDILSQEVLQEALADFDGALLNVTHDRYLIRELDTCIWAIEDGQLWEFKRGYDEYQEWQSRRRQKKQAHREKMRGQTEKERAWEAHKAARREAARKARRQTERERAIHRLESRLTQLGTDLAAASEQQKIEQVRRLGAEYNQVEEQLNANLAAWTDGIE